MSESVSLSRSATIRITLNDEARDVAAGTTVGGLVDLLGLPRAKVAVERNREIVPRSTHDAVALESGDTLEIVHFVGGG